jgi:MFS family permease
MPYLIIYYEVSLGMKDYVLIMAPAIVLASVATALWGRVYDKKGFSFSAVIALISLLVGYVLLFIFKDKAMVFIGSLLMMCGYLAGMAVFGAKIRDLTPVGKSGQFQGVRIFSQVLVPGVIGPYIGVLVLSGAEKIVNNDGTESFVPNQNIFLAALAAVALLTVYLLLTQKKANKHIGTTSEY